MLDQEPNFELVIDRAFKETDAYAEFFEKGNTLNAIMDKDGRFIYVNEKWEEVTGFTEEELKSVPFNIFIHLDNFINTKKMYDAISKSDVLHDSTFNCKFRKRDGSYQKISFISATSDEEGLIMITALPLNKK